MKRSVLLSLALLCLSGNAAADSEASFPADWRSWVLIKETVIPDGATPLPDGIPPLFIETIKTYNWINNGQGTRLHIYVNPTALAAYGTHGPYEDGPTAVGVYEDADIVFVTEHLMGEPLYGTYDLDGNDISTKHATFATEVCGRCHQGYSEICIGGTCATPVNPLPAPRSAVP